MTVSLFYDITDHDGGLLASFPMENPNITYKLSDIGTNSCELPFSTPGLSADIFGPKRTDFQVRMVADAVEDIIQGGICGPVGLKTHEDRVRVGGVDWLAWLDQPFNFLGYELDPEDWTEQDIIRYWIEESQQTIIADVLDEMYDGTSETIEYTTSFNGSGWIDAVHSQVIQIGDTQSVLEFIKSVGQLVDPYGFDFFVDWDKLIRFYAPRRLTAENALPIALFTPSGANGLVEIDWQNNGPLSTAAAGMPVASLMKYHSYAPSRLVFRKWLEVLPLNEYYRTGFQVQQATNDIGGLHSNPQKENTITVIPHLMDPFDETFGFYNHVGEVVYVDSEDAFHPYHTVDAPYIVTQQEITEQEGTLLCKMTLDQIY